jgi:hypothetical protein
VYNATDHFRESTMPQRDYPRGEITARGEEILERDILPNLPNDERGRYLVVDVETGDHEIADTHAEATFRLLERRPDGGFYGVRIGESTAFQIGFAPVSRA